MIGSHLEVREWLLNGAVVAKQDRNAPVGANGKLYLAAEDGDVVVVKMGEKYEVLATNHIADDMYIATPAIAGGSIYLRGHNADGNSTLYCIRQ